MPRSPAIVLALALSLLASGCGGSSGGGARQPTALEQKVAVNQGAIDPSWVHCTTTGHTFEGHRLASCHFNDGSGGCFDANTGEDLTVKARARFNGSQLPECWQ